jgi:hypothetical protein
MSLEEMKEKIRERFGDVPPDHLVPWVYGNMNASQELSRSDREWAQAVAARINEEQNEQ